MIRDDGDVNQWIMQFWQYCTGRFMPRSPKIGMMYEGAVHADAAVRDIAEKRVKMLCWNDAMDMTDEIRVRIENAFEKSLPTSCGFEKECKDD